MKNMFPIWGYSYAQQSVLQLGESYRSNLNHFIAKLLERLNSGLAEEDADSYSVYTGMGGNVLT